MNQPQQQRELASVRIDLGLLRLCECVVKAGIQPAIGNVPIWDHGLGDVAAAFLEQSGVPQGPITVVDLARRCGILKAAR